MTESNVNDNLPESRSPENGRPENQFETGPKRLLLVGTILMVGLGIAAWVLMESAEHLPEPSAAEGVAGEGLASQQRLDDRLEVYETVPEEVTFTERSGREIRLGDLRGEAWVASFIFTECRGTCPIMTVSLRKVQDRLGKLSMPVRLVSITVDPENDDPATLAEYAEEYDAGAEWLFLTAPEEVVQSLALDVFRLGIAEGTDPDEPIIHSSRFVLVDAEGRIRGYYEGTTPEGVAKLIEGISMLEDESGY